jgi:hypothetical protein
MDQCRSVDLKSSRQTAARRGAARLGRASAQPWVVQCVLQYSEYCGREYHVLSRLRCLRIQQRLLLQRERLPPVALRLKHQNRKNENDDDESPRTDLYLEAALP